MSTDNISLSSLNAQEAASEASNRSGPSNIRPPITQNNVMTTGHTSNANAAGAGQPLQRATGRSTNAGPHVAAPQPTRPVPTTPEQPTDPAPAPECAECKDSKKREITWSMIGTIVAFLALVASIVFGGGAWFGMNFSNKFAVKSYDASIWVLCHDHEDVKQTPVCQGILSSDFLSTPIRKRGMHLPHANTTRDDHQYALDLCRNFSRQIEMPYRNLAQIPELKSEGGDFEKKIRALWLRLYKLPMPARSKTTPYGQREAQEIRTVFKDWAQLKNEYTTALRKGYHHQGINVVPEILLHHNPPEEVFRNDDLNYNHVVKSLEFLLDEAAMLALEYDLLIKRVPDPQRQVMDMYRNILLHNLKSTSVRAFGALLFISAWLCSIPTASRVEISGVRITLLYYLAADLLVIPYAMRLGGSPPVHTYRDVFFFCMKLIVAMQLPGCFSTLLVVVTNHIFMHHTSILRTMRIPSSAFRFRLARDFTPEHILAIFVAAQFALYPLHHATEWSQHISTWSIFAVLQIHLFQYLIPPVNAWSTSKFRLSSSNVIKSIAKLIIWILIEFAGYRLLTWASTQLRLLVEIDFLANA